MLRLPIATGAQGRAWTRRTFRAHLGEFVAVSGLLGLATVTGLAGPQILGSLVDSVAGGGARIGRGGTDAGLVGGRADQPARDGGRCAYRRGARADRPADRARAPEVERGRVRRACAAPARDALDAGCGAGTGAADRRDPADR